jgi:predicted 2-oxoglutarate/Fe(II)-dependent dioxygenase YbiX
LRYNPGQRFTPHQDGSYVREDNSEASFITIQLYLNDVPESDQGNGSTAFLRDKNSRTMVHCGCSVGKILVFQHDILHQGSELKFGQKYTMRTDVMYKLY